MQMHITTTNKLASLGTVGLLLLAGVAGMVFLLPFNAAHAASPTVSLSTITSGVETAATSGTVGSTLTITGNGFPSNVPVAITTTIGTAVTSWFTSASQNNCGGVFSSNIGGIGANALGVTENSLYTGSGSTACLTTTAGGAFKTQVTVPALPGGAQTISVSAGGSSVSTPFTITPSVTLTVTSGDNNYGFPEEGVPNTLAFNGFGATETVTEASAAFTTTTSCATNADGSCSVTWTPVVSDINSGSKSVTGTGGTSSLTASTTFTVNPWAAFYDATNGHTAFSFLGQAPTSLVIEAHGLAAGTIAANSITVGGVAVSNAAITVGSSGAIYGVVVAPTANVPFGQANVVLEGTTFSYAAGNIASAGITPGAIVTTAAVTTAGTATPWGGALISSIKGSSGTGTAVLGSDKSSYMPGSVTYPSTTSPAPQQNTIAFIGYGFLPTTATSITSGGATITGAPLTPSADANGAVFKAGILGDTPWSTSGNPTVAATYSPVVSQAGGPANFLGPSFGITPWIDSTNIAAYTVDATTSTETFTAHGFGATDVLTATIGGASMVSGGTCTATNGACTTAAAHVPDLAGGAQNVVISGSVTAQSASLAGVVTYDPISTFFAGTPSTALSIVAGPSGSTTILRTSTGANIFGVHGLAASTAYDVVWNGMGSTQVIGTFTSTSTGGIPVPGVQVTLPADVAGIHVIDLDKASSVGTSALFASTNVGDLKLTDTADTTGLGATLTTNYGDMLFNLGTSLIATPTVANVGQHVAITGSGLADSTQYDLGVSVGGVGSGTTPTTCALTGTGPASPPTVIVGSFTSTSTGAVPAGTALALTDMPTTAGLEQGTLYCAFAQTGANFGTTTAVGTAQFLLAASGSDNMTSAPEGHNVVMTAHGLAANTGYNVIFAPYTNPGTSAIVGTTVGAVLTNQNGAGQATFTVPTTYNTATGSASVVNGQTYTVQLQRTSTTTVALAAPPSLTVSSVSATSCNTTSCLTATGSPTQTQIGANTAVQTSFTNTSNAPVTAIVYAVVHNAAGQTVSYSTATITAAAGGSATAYDVLFGLAPGTYSVTIFATSTSGTAISTTSTATVTIG